MTDKPKQPEESPAETREEPFPGIVTGSEVEASLRGATFPMTAREVVERARLNGAEEHVVERLTELPDRRFTSLGDALRSLDMLS